MHDPIDPNDNHVTVCVIKTVGNQPNVRVIADDFADTDVAMMLRMIADDLDKGIPKAQMAARKN